MTQYFLRYGSVSFTFDTTVRRQLSMESDQKRLVHTLDACHLSSIHRCTFGNITSTLQNNESSSFWSFLFECEKNAIKSRLSCPKRVFVFDQ